MAGAVETIKLADFGAWLERTYGAAALQSLNWKPIFSVVSQFLISGTLANFNQGHDPDGVPWKPLKRPRTRTKSMGKAGAGGSDLPLRDEGLMAASVTSREDKNHFESIDGSTFTFGTRDEKASHHQFGAPRANIPIREFLGFSPSMEDQIVDAMAEMIADQLGNRLQPPGA